MATEKTIPVPLSCCDVDHFLHIARANGQTLPDLLRAILETVAEDDRKAEK